MSTLDQAGQTEQVCDLLQGWWLLEHRLPPATGSCGSCAWLLSDQWNRVAGLQDLPYKTGFR